jgi:arginine repressor
MGAKRIYDYDLIINESKKILREQFKSIQTMKDLHAELEESFSDTTVEVPTFVTFTRIIRKYLNKEPNTQIKREDLLKMALIDINIESFAQLCKVLDETQVTSIDTNNTCLFIRIKPPFTTKNIDYILKKRFPKSILATVCDSNTITVFTKDIDAKKKIVKKILSTQKKNFKTDFRHINFKKYNKAKHLCYISGVQQGRYRDPRYPPTYSKEDIESIFILLFNLLATMDKYSTLAEVHEQLLEIAKPKQIKIPTLKTLTQMLKQELINRKIIHKKDTLNITLPLIKRLIPYYCDFCYCVISASLNYSTLIVNFKLNKISDEALFENVKFLKQELLKPHHHKYALMFKESYPDALVIFLKTAPRLDESILLKEEFLK